MGQKQSTAQGKEKPPGLVKIIDFIATKYILTQDFQDMKRLADPEYCNRIVIMTSKILNDYLDSRDVEFLAKEREGGVHVGEMMKEKLTYMRKDDLEKLDMRSPLEKKRMCIGIAKYYVKIAHLFSAILTTVNPQYKYTDKYGQTVRVPISKKGDIPEGVNAKLSRSNICSTRINALLGGQKVDSMGDTIITIKPNFCGMNRGLSGVRSLHSEPGMPELKQLYFDVYDYEDGLYKRMSPKMKSQYKSDVAKLYKVFTGDEEVPENVKNFGDIKLKDYHKSEGCKRGGVFDQLHRGSAKDKLFVEYVAHIKEMMKVAEANQNKLLAVIDVLFAYSTNPQTYEKEITINPKLTSEVLQQAVDQTRDIIMRIYVQCEKDFAKGLNIFKAIVEKQFMETEAARVAGLTTGLDNELGPPDEKEAKVPAPDSRRRAPAPPVGLEERVDKLQDEAAAPDVPAPEERAAAAPEPERAAAPEPEPERRVDAAAEPEPERRVEASAEEEWQRMDAGQRYQMGYDDHNPEQSKAGVIARLAARRGGSTRRRRHRRATRGASRRKLTRPRVRRG